MALTPRRPTAPLAACLAPLPAAFGRWRIEIVTRPKHGRGFKPLPKRWIIERTFAWLTRNRRLAKDFEGSIASSQAWVLIASVQLLSRRLARAEKHG